MPEIKWVTDRLALDHCFLEKRLVAIYALVTERRKIERLESPVNDKF